MSERHDTTPGEPPPLPPSVPLVEEWGGAASGWKAVGVNNWPPAMIPLIESSRAYPGFPREWKEDSGKYAGVLFRVTWSVGPPRGTVDSWRDHAPTLPEICLDVRASISGASDPWPDEQLKEVHAMLRGRLDTWDSSRDPMDMAVQLMVSAALRIIEVEIGERATR